MPNSGRESISLDDGQVMSPPDDSPTARAEMRAHVTHLQSVLLPTVNAFVTAVEEISSTLPSTTLDAHYVTQLPLAREELGKLNAKDVFVQLADFADHLQHQLKNLVVAPLNEYKQSIDSSLAQAKTFDDESEGLDAAALKYLSLSRDSLVETRAYAAQDLSDKAAGVALQLHDTRTSLRHACDSQRYVPQKALGELLVSQLAYHQSCARLLTEVMPQVSAALWRAEGAKRRAAGV